MPADAITITNGSGVTQTNTGTFEPTVDATANKAYGIVGGLLAVTEKCSTDVAIEKPPGRIARGIEPLARAPLDLTEVGRVIVHRRRHRAEASGEVDSQRPEIAHAYSTLT